MKGKSYTKIILITFLILVSAIYLQSSTDIKHKSYTPAKLGFMDLSNQNLEDSIIALDGEWEFYPYVYTSTKLNDMEYITVPQRWNSTVFEGEKLSADAFGTYRLRLKLSKEGLYCFHIRFVSSAYRLYINDVWIAESGALYTSDKNEVATWEPKIIPYHADTKEIEVVLQVSNYHHNKGGIINSIFFGSYTSVNDNNLFNIIKSAFIMGIFSGLVIYLILIYQSGSKKYTYLYLSLFCISTLLLESIIDAGLIYYIWNSISFSMISKLEYIAYIGQNIALQLFLKSIYPKEANKTRFIIIHIMNLGYLILVILTPIKIFGYSDLIYITIFILNCINLLITLLKAIYHKCKYSIFLLTGFLIMLFTCGIDILYANNYTYTYSTSSNYILGLLFFLICQIYVQSIDIQDAFKSSAKAKDMEIAFLQAQIAPHFFFNTLNNIYCLMEQSVPKAKNLILDFCNFLRVKHKFDYREHIYYTLKEELDLVSSYIKIENARFLNAILLEIDVAEEYKMVSIPQLLIQPIVENSIKHGLGSHSLTINIAVINKSGALEIIVGDNGKGMGKEVAAKILDDLSKTSGVGLKNVNYRLMKCYKTKLRIDSKLGIGTKISFEIPLEVKA